MPAPYSLFVYAAGNPPTLLMELDLSTDAQGFSWVSGLLYNQPTLTISGTPIPGAIVPPNPVPIPQQAIASLVAIPPVIVPPLPPPPPAQIYVSTSTDAGVNFVYMADFAYMAKGLECGNLLQGSVLGLENPRWRSQVKQISWTGLTYQYNPFARCNVLRLDLDTPIDRMLAEGDFLTIVTP